MNKELVDLVGVYLHTQKAKYSDIWKNKLYKRAEKKLVPLPGPGDSDAQLIILEAIESCHAELILNLQDRARRFIARQFEMQIADVEMSVDKAWKVFERRFDASLNSHPSDPECSGLYELARRKALTALQKHGLVDTGLEIDGNGSINTLHDGQTRKYFHARNPEKEEEPDHQAQVAIVGSDSYLLAGLEETRRFYDFHGRLDVPADAKNKAAYEKGFDSNGYPVIWVNAFEFRHEGHKPSALPGVHAQYVDLEHFNLLDTIESEKFHMRRLGILRSSRSRRFMELAISELRKSLNKKMHCLEEMAEGEEKEALRKTPVLSAVAVSADGKHVFKCYKGEMDEIKIENGKKRDITWGKHCEYELFENKIGGKKKALFKGGELYVTLEPCNKRGPTEKDGVRREKKPCALRCLEMGFKKVYLASLDYNPEIEGDGIQIITTGQYSFDLKNGRHTGSTERVENSIYLEKGFRNDYPLVSDSNSKRVYEIVKGGLEFALFDPDLLREAYDLNEMFQREKRPDAYRKANT
jgi:pyrimidine deaminase RibD-like protein